MSDTIKRDERGNVIYGRDSDGFEYWYEYDENNNVTHFRDSGDYEEWCEYDENTHLTYHHFRNSDGYECWYEYDAKGNRTHFRDNNGDSWGTPRKEKATSAETVAGDILLAMMALEGYAAEIVQQDDYVACFDQRLGELRLAVVRACRAAPAKESNNA